MQSQLLGTEPGSFNTDHSRRMLPLAAIVTPGTITVQSALSVTTEWTFPPQLDLNSTKFAIVDPEEGAYIGPNSELMRNSLASAAQATILPITPPFINATYNLQFHGPAVTCDTLSATDVAALNKSLIANYDQYNLDEVQYMQVDYLTWAPNPPHNTFSNPGYGNVSTSSNLDTWSRDGAKLYLYMPKWKSPVTGPAMLFGCTLQNASYDVNFDFSSGKQHITIDSLHNLNAVSAGYPGDSPINIQLQSDIPVIVYWAVMNAFSNMLAGVVTETIGNNEQENPDGERALSYSSPLIETTVLQAFIDRTDSLDPTHISHVLEEMFQNITLSLFASSQFR